MFTGAGAEASDARLIELAAAGDRDAFGALVERHQAAVFRYARAVAGDAAAAEDALQETFLAAWSGAASFRGGDVRAWLLTIARNAVFRARRLRSGQPREHEPLDRLGVEAGWGDAPMGPEELAMRLEDRRLVTGALAALAAADREIVLLRDVEGLSGEEAAAVLGIPLASMKTRLHRARLRLTAELRRRMK